MAKQSFLPSNLSVLNLVEFFFPEKNFRGCFSPAAHT